MRERLLLFFFFINLSCCFNILNVLTMSLILQTYTYTNYRFYSNILMSIFKETIQNVYSFKIDSKIKNRATNTISTF